MITIGGFILGLFIAGLGFVMVWRRRWFQEYVGDLGTVLQFSKVDWMDWSILGVALLLIGFIVMFGLFQSLALAILGPLFRPSIQ
jgi:hypothetical protein